MAFFRVGTASSIRYNTDTDWVQIKDANGWHDWKSGGLLNLYAYKDGDLCADVSGGWSHGGSGTHTETQNLSNLYAKAGSGASACTSYWETNDAIDVSDYSKLKINLLVTTSHGSNKLVLKNGTTEVATIFAGKGTLDDEVEINISSIDTLKPRLEATTVGSNTTEFYLNKLSFSN